MQTVVVDVNEKNDNKFNISVVSKDDWTKFTKTIIVGRLNEDKSVKMLGSFVNIRDNKAKVKICWEDNLYHEFEFHIDEFGRSSKGYQDLVSQIWQNIMTDYYQEEYVIELDAKLVELQSQTI